MPIWRISKKIVLLRPKGNNLSLEEQEKIYNMNFYLFTGILIMFIAQIMFFFLSTTYPAGLLALTILIHIALIVELFKDPTTRNYFIETLILYSIGFGPLFIHYCRAFMGVAIIMGLAMPIIILYAFRNLKVAFLLVGIEVFKILKVYLHQIIEIVDTSVSKDELIKLIYQEATLIALSLPIIFVVLYGFYEGYNANIEAVARITKELESSKRTLEQKELLVLSLSHEARNPLNSIIGNIDFVYEEMTNSYLKKRLRKAKISGDVLLYLINNFIDTGKINTGNLDICLTECNLVSFIQNIWLTFEELIKSKGLEPKLILPNNLPKIVRTDQNRIAQILYNLISNAIKFTEKGTITFKVSFTQALEEERLDTIPNIPEETTESISTVYQKRRNSLSSPVISKKTLVNLDMELALNDETAGVLRFDVIDTGIGMSIEDQAELFDKYNLPGQNRHKTKLGVGLGLWIIKEICKKMGADIKANSELGIGTKFSLFVNCTQVIKSPLPEPKIMYTSADSLPLMIVDDEPFNIEIIATYMRSYGLQVTHTASDGVEALKIYEASIEKNNPIRLVTMDLEMPGMHGKRVCKEIRKLEEIYAIYPKTKIIIITGNSVEREVTECLDPNGEIKADYFLRKPVKKDELKTLLNLMLTNNYKPPNGVILFVDTSIQNHKMVDNTLYEYGYKGVLAKNEAEAMEEIEKYKGEIKAVVVNCEMEELDGIKLAEKIVENVEKKNYRKPALAGLIDIMHQSFLEKAKVLNMKIENRFIFFNNLIDFLKTL